MDKLDDLSICKRIAEIDGVDYIASPSNIHASIPTGEIKNHNHWSYDYSDFNPLTDDALCFQLMVKHKVEIEFDSDLNYVCSCNNVWANNENPNKAICLAIIEAHEK